jgi:hypothetical protein
MKVPIALMWIGIQSTCKYLQQTFGGYKMEFFI